MNPLENIAAQLTNLEKRKDELKGKIHARLDKAILLRSRKLDICSDITKNEIQISAYQYEYRAIDREHYSLSNLPTTKIKELLVEAYGEAAAKKVLAMIKEAKK